MIYLGSEKPRMRTELSEEEQITGFELQDIRNFPTQSTLNSEVPEGIILSILTDYKKSDADKIIEEIIYKLQKASKSESELRKSIKQLIVLSRLRKLEVKIKQKLKDMPITYDIKTDGLYNEGIREGIQKGRKEGIQKGQEQGMERTKKEITLNLIKAGLNNETISKATGLSTEQIESLRKKQ